MFDLVYRFDLSNVKTRQAPQTWQEACQLLVP